MAIIPFTIRELKRASIEGNVASSSSAKRNNHQLLLLFYAVECGLKTIILKNANKSVIDKDVASGLAHDINGILSKLRVSKEYFLPQDMSISNIKSEDGETIQRKFSCGELNQVWRYGASMDAATTKILEEKLVSLMDWIQQEI